ncbi:MAG: twin-arginine translocase subunit TatC [Muribaculaceae bacterium]|nr:twin-arginine translocase subunit TatC [Muribaculaceae bacterium]
MNPNPTRKNKPTTPDDDLMTFGGHLEVLRRMLFRVVAVTITLACVIFAFKTATFNLLLAPSEWNFATYRWIEQLCKVFNPAFRFNEFHVDLIATDLSSQFMTHISTSIYLALLFASPLILFELFHFISPALLENEKRYSTRIVFTIYILFIMGVLMSYYIIFPLSFRFLGTYSVADKIHSTITLDSYIATFVSLTFLMGLVFQLPVIAFIMAKMQIINSDLLAQYRSYAFLIICLVAAIITPPDVMTLILVAIPLYLLYEVSIRIVKNVYPRN